MGTISWIEDTIHLLEGADIDSLVNRREAVRIACEEDLWMPDPSRRVYAFVSALPSLFDWFGDNYRDFPWRRTRDPWEVLTAEILLQRTHADQVARVYDSFIERFPEPAAVYAADREEVFGSVEMLGFGNRKTRTLEALAESIVEDHGGEVPDDLATLQKLPRIGPYTARACLCFAYGRPLALVEFELIAEVGLRMGAVRAIDLEDIDGENLVIHLRHRPESRDEYGTPLKNGADGERIVNISDALQRFIEDYVEHNRQDILDEYDRAPLFTTPAGRVTTTTMRRDFYKMTRPCTYSNECPHDREPADCEATQNRKASQCPSSFSTHPLRKWSIMHQLDEGVPKELLSDRVDVSVPVLDKHYDQRSEERKSRRRREALVASLPQYAMTDGGTPTEREEI